MSQHNAALEVTAFRAANSRAYLDAVFEAYAAGQVVMVEPASNAGIVPDGVTVTQRKSFEDAPGWFEARLVPRFDDAPAQISFSSGTTGTPKALLLPHRALADVVARINTAMEIDETIREYIGVPVTFSFGFGRARAVATVGGRSYLPPNGFDPLEIAQMLRAGEINAISAVPTLWRVVLANPDVIGAAGGRVRWIEIGSQYMARAEKEAMKALFPNARIVQHYGLTEASRSTLLDITATTGPALESVGRAEGEVELAIAPDGAIRVRGPHVALGQLTRDGLVPLTDAQGWLTTSDRGRLEEGWLYYEGRMDELINCGGIKIDPNRFEQKLIETVGHPQALAVGRMPDALRGDRVLVVVAPEDGLGPDEVRQAAGVLAESYGLTGNGAVEIRPVAEIPRTATNKVQRAKLADLPALAEVPRASEGGGGGAGGALPPQAVALQKIWAEVLGIEDVSVHDSFYDLGGDSLSALSLVMSLERHGLEAETARGIYDGKTIADLVGLPARIQAPADATPQEPPERSWAQTMNAVHAARGVLALWVVIIHWLPGVLERVAPTQTWIYDALTPLWRLGTPGFALVFGIGMGALRLPQYEASPSRYAATARFNTRMLVLGVGLIAAFKLGRVWSEGGLARPDLAVVLFYSVVTFYMLALIGLPWLMGLVIRGRNRLLALLAGAVLALGIHEILAAIFSAQQDGVVELIRLLLTANYGLFRMLSYVLLGAALGHILRRHHMRPHLAREIVQAGGICLGFGVLMLYKAQPGAMLEGFGHVRPWHLVIYLGAVLVLLAGFLQLNRTERAMGGWTAAAVTTGILALPIFVGHEIVLPAKNILSNLGVPGVISLAVPVLIFLGGFALAYRRLMGFLLKETG